MKIAKKPSNKRIVLVIASVAVVLCIFTFTAYALNPGLFQGKGTAQPAGPTEEERQEQSKTEADAKKEFIESTKDQDLPGTNPTVPSSSDTITISATQDAGTVTLSSKLAGFSSGSCRLEITNGTVSISETADIIYQPEFSTCAGFSIVKEKLGKGTWSMTLFATPANGTELQKSISFEVR